MAERKQRKGQEEDLPELVVPETEQLVTAASDTLPSSLGDRYETVSRLGAGAFGAVYRARDRLLGRDVAIKTIRLEAFVEPGQLDEVKKRFLREAQVAAGLRHPNIVTTHDIVETPSTSFIVMELVEGRTLQALLVERGRLELDEAVGIIGQAAAALDHAHASLVIHRDVKPANLMIEANGHVKVMDFGIAKVETGQNLTSTGLIMGTPNYMSPEQARGEKVDARSDVFSLGCVLYECLTGTKPFQAETVTGILVKILTQEPPLDFDSIGLPHELGAVLRRAMAKQPAARFASAAEMMAAVRAAAPTLVAPATVATARAIPPPLPSQGSSPAPVRVPPRALKRIMAMAALLAVLAGGAWVVGTLAGGGHSRPSGGDDGPTPLVVHEDVGTLGRLLGREPRLLVTLPSATPILASLEAAVSSETARSGDEVSAEVTRAVRIEGVEAVAAGSRLIGQVTHAAPASESGGRGEMTLEFGSIELPGGERVSIHTSPLVLRAPPPSKRKDAGVIAGLAGIGAAVGGLVGGKKGAAAGTVVGGAAGVGVVKTDKGQEVTLSGRSQVRVSLVEPVTLARPPEKAD